MSGFWIWIAPTGCVRGSADADLVGPLAEDAHREFTPRIADRRREAVEGWRVELIPDEAWAERAGACLRGRCGHHRGRPVQGSPLTKQGAAA